MWHDDRGEISCRRRGFGGLQLAICLCLSALTCAANAADTSVRETLVAELNQQCKADIHSLLAEMPRHEGFRVPAESVPAVCKCADEGIRKDRGFDNVASLPSGERQQASKAMSYVRQSYLMYGLECLEPAKGEGYPIQPPDRSIVDVTKVLRGKSSDFYSLYRGALNRHAGMSGSVVVVVRIEPSGAVSEVAIRSSTLHDEQFERDLASAIRAIDFGAREARSVVLTYPLKFVPH